MHEHLEHQLECLLSIIELKGDDLSIGPQKLSSEDQKEIWTQHCTYALYQYGYVCRADIRQPISGNGHPERLVPKYDHILSLATDAIELDTGWMLDRKSTMHDVRLSKGNISTIANPGNYLFEDSHSQSQIALPVYKIQENPGDLFTYIFGSEPQHVGNGDTVRFYFNARSEQVVDLVLLLRTTFDTQRIPFILKFIRYENNYPLRKDNLVIYISKAFANRTAKILKDDYPKLEKSLYRSCPLFIYQICPGIGFGESPPNPQDSFGMSRCRIIALKLHELTTLKVPKELWIRHLADQLNSYKFNVEKFYLNPNSGYYYTFLKN